MVVAIPLGQGKSLPLTVFITLTTLQIRSGVYHPDDSEFEAMANQGDLVPVYREIDAGTISPVTAYLKITAETSGGFLLESVQGQERLARYSFIGTNPYKTIRAGHHGSFGGANPLTVLEKELNELRVVENDNLPRFAGGAVGYLGYECCRYFEPSVPQANPSQPLELPEAMFMLVDTMVVFDHVRHKIQIISHARIHEDGHKAYKKAVDRIAKLIELLAKPLSNPLLELPKADYVSPNPDGFEANLTQSQYYDIVKKAKDYIVAGDIIQVVLSRKLKKTTTAKPFDIYRSLRENNPSPYTYYLDFNDFQIIGASPELLVRVEEGQVTTHPIAGTRRRGVTQSDDKALERELIQDEKEIAEHIMLVDLGRNDIGRVSELGSVQVTKFMEVEKYSHVMHLVSHVSGKIDGKLTCFDAIRACFPAGTVSGAPKVRAMEIIAELEPENRGTYAGAVGYFGFSGNMDTAITIRTIVMHDRVAYIQTGGGVVFDSTPEGEFKETLHKAGALLAAVQQAEAVFPS